MPTFPQRYNPLAKGFSQSCGVEIEGLKQFVDMDVNELKKAGETLVSTLCITCHGLGEHQPNAVFEGQGVNLLFLRFRMRGEHYMHWMLNPYRINQAIIIPKFADEEGRAGLIDLLDGDARRQFGTVGHYLQVLSN